MPNPTPPPPPSPLTPAAGSAATASPGLTGRVLPTALAGALSGGIAGLVVESIPLLPMVGGLAAVGGLVGALLVSREQTRQALAEAAEARQQATSTRARDQAFFERLSQEFRTPLTLILAGFRALQEEREAPIKVRREVASAGLRNAARLLLVLHELGSLAAMEPGPRAPRKRNTDLAALIRRVIGNFSASGLGRKLDLAGLDGSLNVSLDPHQIQTVLYSVLSSAFERTDPVSGTIRVSLQVGAQEVSLEVQDDGAPPGPEPGLDPTVTAQGGPGLGLAVLREIVGAHQGQVEVAGTQRGLSVRIRLPRGEVSGAPVPFSDERTEVQDVLQRLALQSPAEDAPTEEADGLLDPARPLIMVVLTNGDLRAWLKRVLSARYAVVSAADVVRARLLEVRPELVVTDADPPDAGSISLVAEIRRDPVLCGTPILGLMSRTVARDSTDPDGLAADDYLPMPFESDELLARVANLVRCRSLAEENASLRRQLEASVEVQIRELVRKGEIRRYLPQALLEGSLRRPADDDEEDAEYDRRWLTVVHCALHGFGDLAERMDPEDLARLLNTWAREAAAEANLLGGVVDQHFGDSLTIFFGAPDSQRPSEQAVSALRVAFAISKRTRALAERWHRYGLPRDLDLRTGIHTGLGLVGVLGSELTRRYTAFGPAVHVASRLSIEASNPGLLVSLATFAHVRAQVESSQAGTLAVEGLSRPVEIYAIRGFKDEPGA